MTRKITRALARIKLGRQDCLRIGNLDAKRDWGHARDYVEMQWLMLQQETPEDYVIATGTQYSVRDFITRAADCLDMQLEWQGEGQDERAYWANGPQTNGSKKPVVAVDPRYFRPAEVQSLIGDASKAREKLGWEPKISFDELVEEMVTADMQEAEAEARLSNRMHF